MTTDSDVRSDSDSGGSTRELLALTCHGQISRYTTDLAYHMPCGARSVDSLAVRSRFGDPGCEVGLGLCELLQILVLSDSSALYLRANSWHSTYGDKHHRKLIIMPIPLIHYLYGTGVAKYLRHDARDKDSWALVTGATDGIGRALCDELASQGFNVVLHGRNASKLATCKTSLDSTHPNKTFRTVAVDAANFTTDDIARIVQTVSDVQLSMLVNNVGGTGVLSSNFKYFETMRAKELEDIYALNVQFPLRLTHALLPQMEALGRPALVVTCGSQAGVGQPYLAAYSGTKAALHAWNRALAAEHAKDGSNVDILEVIIAATYTQQLQKDPKISPSLFTPTAETMAKAIVARLGNGHRSVHAYFWHWAQSTLVYGVLPVRLADKIVADIMLPFVTETKPAS